jgi:hypothetical protein
MRYRSVLAWLLALVVALALGCSPRSTALSAERTAELLAAKPFPDSLAQVEELREQGVSWTNQEVRLHYNRIVGTIGPANERWKQEGLPTEERARRAYTMRHDARLLTRAMMSDAKEVEELRTRDLETYGNPDGPTFEQLVERQRSKGVSGDAVYQAIIDSSQRTNEAVNKRFGLQGSSP